VYSIYGILQLLLFFSGHEANVHFEAWDLVPRVPYFSAENVHAAFIILVIPFLYQDILAAKKIIRFAQFLAAFLINLGGLLATGSRGAILALAIALTVQSIIFAFKNRSRHGLKKATAIFAIIATFVITYWDSLFIRFNALANGDDGTTYVRISQYEFIFNKFLEHPFLGIGLGQSLIISGHDVHNVVLQVLFEGGVIAFFFYFLFMALPFIKLLIHRRVDMKFHGGRPLAAFSGASAVLLQALAEPSLYFYHLYLSLSLIIFVSSRTFSNQR
jgi:O-antigen ligase